MTIQKIFSSRSVANIDTFVGDKGHLFYSETDGVLRLSDGFTPGGTIVSSSGGSNVNLTAVSTNIIPTADNTYTLGSPTLRWKSVYVGPGTIYLTDTVTNSLIPLTVNNGTLQVNGTTVTGSGSSIPAPATLAFAAAHG